MKKLVWIGNPFFYAELQSAWDVVWHMPKTGEFVGWNECCRLAGEEPDVVVMADMSQPPALVGMENFPCRTVYYAVDTHIHSWEGWYAQGFDACLVSLKDHLPRFVKRLPAERVWWSPPYAPPLEEEPMNGEQDLDVVFIGTVSPENTPLRAAFLEELQRHVSLTAQWGKFCTYFPRAKAVVNVCEHGDLNFRVFEALGLGAALVTPAVNNGQSELFEDGRQLLTYPLEWYEDEPPADVAERGRRAALAALPRLREVLTTPDVRRTLGREGLALVNAHHRRQHRAEQFMQRMQEVGMESVAARQAQAEAIRRDYLRLIYLHWSETLPDPRMKVGYLKAAQGKI